VIDYKFKTKPFDHQLEVFNISRDLEAYALFLEQGCGKSKVIIDTTAWLYSQGKIDTLIIIAPNGVHQNWVLEEIPIHMPEYIQYKSVIWQAQKAKTIRFKKELNNVFEADCLRILAMNIDSVITKNGKSVLKSFLMGNCLYIIDESQTIKTPGAQRTKAIINSSVHALYKRVLTGTPVTNNGPLDLYTQFQFLDENILDFTSYYTFRNHFAIVEQQTNWKAKITNAKLRQHGKKANKRETYSIVKSFRNMDELKDLIDPYSYRKTKAECLDLPPKLYEKIFVDLSPNQKKLYKQLQDSLIAEFQGEELTALLAISKLIRFQQITGGFFPTDDGNILQIDDLPPKAKICQEIVEASSGKVIIFALFVEEIKLLNLLFKNSLVYYGNVSQSERPAVIKEFQEGDKKVIIIGIDTGYRGLTLTAASTVIYYSNHFSLEKRIQSEDRAHRIGQDNKVTYFDIIANDVNIDKKIIDSLRNNKEIANLITGDNYHEWI
jgi:SNF2 family DNA or RNA helicase